MRYLLTVAACTAILMLAIFLAPAPEASAGGYHWEAGAATKNQDGEWVIWAEFKNPEGGVEQTVQTGTTDGKRKSKRASRKLAESLNEGGSEFKWDPACEGALFNC